MTTVFVTGTGTGVGKTFVTRGLARAAARRGLPVAAVKPIETGCEPEPLDAIALARACGRTELATCPGFYRARAAVAPYAAAHLGEPPPSLDSLVEATRRAIGGARPALVEGAGGLLVPYDRERDLSDFARALDAALVLVAPDALGTLSQSIAALEAAAARGLHVAALVLTQASSPDASRTTNALILRERFPSTPIVVFPHTRDDDDALADAAEHTGLAEITNRV